MKMYRKKNVQAMRPYVDGECLEDISISGQDLMLEDKTGGMIAVAANDPTDQWFINAEYFMYNYEVAE